jgi:hypothetical protein
MFWKKKQAAAVPVSAGATKAAGVTPSAIKVEAPPQRKAEKPKVEKLPGPRPIPGLVGKHLTDNYKMDAELVRILKAVVHERPQTERTFDCRIFDQSEAEAKEVQINDYNTLNQHPDLILYEGWFDEETKRVEMAEKKKVSFDVPLFTETEIRQKVEALSEPGSTVFFYQAAGPAHGGPLGMGAAVIELNPNYPAKKGKKYIIYTANVINMQPVGKGQKLYDSDKPKEIAKWVAQGHHKRTY